jgi:LmbE family N-acetylglucosaminyl deacetylase
MEPHKILVLAPHTDDAELGCGGTIARFLEQGADVFVAAFSTAQESLPPDTPHDTLRQEFLQAMQTLGVPRDQLFVRDFRVRHLSEHRQEVLEDLVSLRAQVEPDLVLLPSVHDMHQDHQVVHAEGLRAFKDISVLGYELLWNHISFDAQAFVRLEERHVESKQRGLQCYQSQILLKRPYFEKEFIMSWARMRGLQVKAALAEAFEVMRLRW